MSLSGCKGKSFFHKTKEKEWEFEIILKMCGAFWDLFVFLQIKSLTRPLGK